MEKTENKFFKSIAKGDRVCFMNDRIQVEVDEVANVFYSHDAARIKFVALRFCKGVIAEPDSARLFPYAKRERLALVVNALLDDTETDIARLQDKMLLLMTEQENIPLFPPQPKSGATGFDS